MIDAATRRAVRQRAGERCEYCQLPEQAAEVPFHIEHITARQHGGGDDPWNLALACDRCNLHKGPNLTTVDETTGQVVPLFHPRRDTWSDHFRWDGVRAVGLTPTGRATIDLLRINAPRRVQLRASLSAAGEWRP